MFVRLVYKNSIITNLRTFCITLGINFLLLKNTFFISNLRRSSSASTRSRKITFFKDFFPKSPNFSRSAKNIFLFTDSRLRHFCSPFKIPNLILHSFSRSYQKPQDSAAVVVVDATKITFGLPHSSSPLFRSQCIPISPSSVYPMAMEVRKVRVKPLFLL